MDEDDEYIRLTGNDAEAERLLAIALEFENATQPLTSSYIQKNFYGDCPTDEAARKAFSRDRKKLMLCGVNIIQGAIRGDQKSWLIDAASSYASEGSLSAEDALVLDLACAPLADNPSFPYSNDLRVALAKIDRSFQSGTPVRISESSRDRSNKLAVLESAAADHLGIEVLYRKPNGEADERLLGILGFFSLRGNTYVVAIRLDDEAAVGNTPAHVYNVSRIESAKVRKTAHYSVPDDFNIRDFVRLPFQLGPAAYQARFAVPKNRMTDLAAASHGQGSFEPAASDGQLQASASSDRIWNVSVSDEKDAAAWAISLGIRPLEPQSLVQAWRNTLKQASAALDTVPGGNAVDEPADEQTNEPATASVAVAETTDGFTVESATKPKAESAVGNASASQHDEEA